MGRHALILLGLLALTAFAYRDLTTAGFVYEDNNPMTALDLRLDNDARGPWTTWAQESAYLKPVPRGLPNLLTRIQGWSHAGARGFHLANLGIHVLNGILLSVVAESAMGPTGAVIAAGAFLLHPVNSEAVSYVSARTDLLLATAILLLLFATERDSLIGVTLAGMLAVLAKESGVVVIGLLPLWLWLRGTWARRWWMPLGIWTGCGAIAAYQLLHVSARAGALHPWGAIWQYTSAAAYGPIEVVGLQIAACWRLVALVVVPYGFAIDHDFDVIPVDVAANVMVITIALLLALYWRRWSQPWAWFACAWGLIVLSPRLIIPLPEYLHEQHLYVLLIGTWLALGAVIPQALEALARDWQRTRHLWTQGVTQ